MKKLLVWAIFPVMTGCVSTKEASVQDNSALMLGEAAYFTSRCPNLKQSQQRSALIVACLSNKANVSECKTPDGRPLAADIVIGVSKSKQEFGSLSEAQVCRIADERYGKNGSHFRNLLILR
jgi:hypothetical protein